MTYEDLTPCPRKEYYPDGKLKEIYPYNDDGLLDGVVKKYYPSGKLQSEETYKNNILEGMFKWYYENGKLMGEANFKDDKKLSGTCYDERGNIIKYSKK